MANPQGLFSQTLDASASEIEDTQDPLLNETDLPVEHSELSSLGTSKTEATLLALKNSDEALARLASRKRAMPSQLPQVAGAGVETTEFVQSSAEEQAPLPVAEAAATNVAPPPAAQPKPAESPIIPDPYPGAGKGVSAQFWAAWPALKAKLDTLPLMSLATLKNLGPKDLDTDHGKVTLPPYLQLSARFVARYYGETLPAVSSGLAMKSVATCYKAIRDKTLQSTDVEVVNFASTIRDKRLGHWVKLVGLIMFDDQTLANVETIENYTRDDFRAAVDQVTNLYPDAGVVLKALANLAVHGEAVLHPIEDFLTNQEDIGKFLNAHCKGPLSGFDIAVRIDTRVVSSNTSYESARSDVEGLNDKFEEDTADKDQTAEGDSSLTESAKRSNNLRIRTRSGLIDLEEEYAGEGEGKGRDTSKFIQNLEFANIKERLESVEKGQSDMMGLLKVVADRLDNVLKKQEKSDAQIAQTLEDICYTLKSLVAQKSLANLKDTTDSLNSTFFAKSDDELDSCDYSINPSKTDKGKGKMVGGSKSGGGNADLTTRLLSFKKEDCTALVADLKKMFNNAGQPAMAAAVSEAMLMKDHVRINMANNVQKFQSFL